MYVCVTASGGVIAGAVIGVLAGVALLAGVGYYFYRKNQQKKFVLFFYSVYMYVYEIIIQLKG